jgi:AraC-like DNA-binding protein
MSKPSELGVLYTEYTRIKAGTPIASLWSYEACSRGDDRHSVMLNRHGDHEYWLERSDPLLNMILPGTGVSLIVNFGDPWAAGRSLATSDLLPPACVTGPVTRARILHVGRSVRAVGIGFASGLTPDVFGVPAADLVDRMIPLKDVWTRADVERLVESLDVRNIRRAAEELKDQFVARLAQSPCPQGLAPSAFRFIARRAGHVNIDEMARSHGLSRQRFARQFSSVAGLPPKLFARVTRFQALVHRLLSTDVSQWASLPPVLGFYDQGHMINEFRAFAGSPPTVFFQPHGGTVEAPRVRLRGRPSDWLNQAR